MYFLKRHKGAFHRKINFRFVEVLARVYWSMVGANQRYLPPRIDGFQVTHQILRSTSQGPLNLSIWGWRRPSNKSFFNHVVAWYLSCRKYSILNLRIVALLDTISQTLKNKIYIPMNLSSLSLSFTLGDVFIHMNFISWAESKRFYR